MTNESTLSFEDRLLITLTGAAIVSEFEVCAQRYQREAETHLARMFGSLVKPLMSSGLTLNQNISLLILSEYFSHRGDWTAMRQCMERNIAKAAGKPVDEIAADVRDLAFNTKTSMFPKTATQQEGYL